MATHQIVDVDMDVNVGILPEIADMGAVGIGCAIDQPQLTLAKQDPRLPFVIASVALVLTSLALAKVERSLAKDAPAKPEPPKAVDRAIPVIVFALATVIFALGFQLHFFFNSAPRFKQFTADVSTLMPIFWVGFSVAMFPASLLTKRWGGLPVMGLFGFIGAIAIVVMEFSGTLEVVVTAQLIAGAAWGGILMSAFSAAAALGWRERPRVVFVWHIGLLKLLPLLRLRPAQIVEERRVHLRARASIEEDKVRLVVERE